MSWKIVADSGCDFKQLTELAPQTSFVRVPLTLQIGNRIFVDDEGLDSSEMMATLYSSSSAASSSCPSPDAFLKAYEGAENIFVVTITGTLSGSYNAARLAKEMLQEKYPQVNIHVIDSLSAGGECDLLVAELNRLIAKGLSFDDIIEAITTYQKQTKLLFVLAKVDNLVKNGRLSKLVGKVVGLLNIRMVGEASQTGTLELLQKARGQKKAVQTSYDEMRKAGYKGGRVSIAHCQNDKICQQLTALIHHDFPEAEVMILPTSGLCSFYAEEGGILLGYEI
ncbi:DegV family protein [Streptococcus saliviloxodontae]|uniref:DegV family protein with EDD domain n=1 Tax=Streptococcus saliviloxodontae TaxID=1349416 RepID=A0ABS2PMZ9_9STRE|nr:DegV family protein [Streptococcus saliviloxodontae]MBM7636746.1 DegV family protein with EDD domain [Streptococcus saliviloxodontae]